MMENHRAAVLSRDPPRLNPQLDRAGLAQDFQRTGRLRIPSIFTPDSAQRIYSCLTNETKYDLVFNRGELRCGASDLTLQQLQECTHAAWRQVGIDGFGYLYESHALSLDGETYADPSHYWASVTAFLNGPEFLGFAREVTGMGEIALADAQATLYRGGHFLTAHHDDTEGSKRLVAYVLSLTPVWRPEWGGALEFPGEGGGIEQVWVPDFNSLRLFRVPTNHFVGCVAPYATAGRYSVTGWLRAS